MKHRHFHIAWPLAMGLLGLLGLLGLAPAALSQTAPTSDAANQAELDALRARVEALEKSGGTSPLKFSLKNGTTIELYGYIKGDLMSDSGFDLGDTTFGLRSIGLPAGPAAGNFTHGHARQSRFGLRIDAGDFMALIEGDFFGTNNAFRLRHAYGEWNGILVGQTWTNFMPLDSYPTTVDFQGPAGIPFARVQQVRYTWENGTGLTLSGSIEDDVSGSSNSPAITGAVKYGFERGSVRLSGISRDIIVGGVDVNSWGVSIGGNVGLWQGGNLLANYTTGDAISDILAFALDGTALYTGGSEVQADGITIGISQDIGDQFTLLAAYGNTDLDRAAGADTKELETVHLTALYKPTDKITFGLEYFTGTRTQGDGIQFDADRVQFGAQFNF